MTTVWRMPADGTPKSRRLRVTAQVGRSPHTFEAFDTHDRRYLVWFLDYGALIPTLPRTMLVGRWQIEWPMGDAHIDLLDRSVSGGLPQ